MMPKHRIKNASQQEALNAKPLPQVEGNLSRYASRISLASQRSTTPRYISQQMLDSTDDEPMSLVAMTPDELEKVKKLISLKVEPEELPLDQIIEEDDAIT